MILICYGTRPEYLKVSPLFDEFDKWKIKYRVLQMQQHTTLIDGCRYDIKVKVKSSATNRLDGIISAIANMPEDTFAQCTHVLVQGDTATTFACGLAGYHRGMKIIHLEAGLRTNDLRNPFPEEGYRQMLSRIASIHFCPTDNNKLSLIKENVLGEIYVVGNTALDSLRDFRQKTTTSKVVLVTIHRTENVPIVSSWFKSFNNLASTFPKYQFVIPVHPNPEIQKHCKLLTRVELKPSLPHNELMDILVTARAVITDSGGIQEEAAFLGKPALVCRKTTEREEALGKTSLMCEEPLLLHSRFEQLLQISPKPLNVFGDGYSSRKIAEILRKNENI